MTQKQLALAIVSGGLDSTTMVYDLLAQDYKVETVSFNYGQRHRKELIFASNTSRALGLRHSVIDLSGLTPFISNSALTSHPGTSDTYGTEGGCKHIDVPEGHYAQDTMKQTVVPNRNMIMLSIACGMAVNRQANTIAMGVHAGDHFIYPDCRPVFIYTLGQAMLAGNEGFHNFDIELDPTRDAQVIAEGFTSVAKPITTPYLNSTKADIAYRALQLCVPFHLTWSCYKGGENHCGRCGTCVERLEAIDEALRKFNNERPDDFPYTDSTVYDDTEYWKIATTHRSMEASN